MPITDYPDCLIVAWRPVVESDFGQERFFGEDPVKIISDGNFTKVPIIIGRTTDEFVSDVPGKFSKCFSSINSIKNTLRASGWSAVEAAERELQRIRSRLLRVRKKLRTVEGDQQSSEGFLSSTRTD